MPTDITNGGSAKRFCTHCGSSLGSEDKFCASCGSPVKAPTAPVIPPVTPAVPPAQPLSQSPRVPERDGETISGAVQVVRKKSMFSFEMFHLIVTSKRIIFAAFTNDMVKEAAKEAGQTGFFSGIVASATIGYTYYKKYLTMDPEAALKENPQNFTIQRNNIRKVKLEIGARHRDAKTRHETWDESKLEIETTSEKYSFRVPHQLHEQAQAVFHQGGLI